MKSYYLTLFLIICFTLFANGCNKPASVIHSENDTDSPTILSNIESDNLLESYQTPQITFTYDSSLFSIEDKKTDSGRFYNVISSLIPDVPQEQYNTVCSFFITHDIDYMEVKSLGIKEYFDKFSKKFFNSQEKKIIDSSYNGDVFDGEYIFTIDDGSTCYFKVIDYNVKETIIAALRTCPYSSKYNNKLFDIYSSVKFTSDYKPQKCISDYESIESYLSSEISTIEKGSNDIIDKIAFLAKNDSIIITDSHIKAAITYIKNTYPNFYDNTDTMEVSMYYGYLLDYCFDDSDPRSELGVDTYQSIKYVYRNIESKDDDSTQKNLQQIKKDLQKL